MLSHRLIVKRAVREHRPLHTLEWIESERVSQPSLHEAMILCKHTELVLCEWCRVQRGQAEQRGATNMKFLARPLQRRAARRAPESSSGRRSDMNVCASVDEFNQDIQAVLQGCDEHAAAAFLASEMSVRDLCTNIDTAYKCTILIDTGKYNNISISKLLRCDIR